jgi:hypothetical protein
MLRWSSFRSRRMQTDLALILIHITDYANFSCFTLIQITDYANFSFLLQRHKHVKMVASILFHDVCFVLCHFCVFWKRSILTQICCSAVSCSKMCIRSKLVIYRTHTQTNTTRGGSLLAGILDIVLAIASWAAQQAPLMAEKICQSPWNYLLRTVQSELPHILICISLLGWPASRQQNPVQIEFTSLTRRGREAGPPLYTPPFSVPINTSLSFHEAVYVQYTREAKYWKYIWPWLGQAAIGHKRPYR